MVRSPAITPADAKAMAASAARQWNDIPAQLRARGQWRDGMKTWEPDALCQAAAERIEQLEAANAQVNEMEKSK